MAPPRQNCRRESFSSVYPFWRALSQKIAD
jgi:hypothetical protein